MNWITLQEPRAPLHTMVCPFSRGWAVEPWFDSFREWWLPERMELLVIADTDNHAMQSRIRERLLEERHRLAGIRLLCTDNPKLPERARGDLRRPRVIGHWERFLEAALAPIILAAEDDTLPDHDAYPRILETYHRTGAAFVQGTEVARWSINVIPHWRITEENGRVVRIDTATYEGKDLVEIDGGGWYCCAIDRDKMRAMKLHWTDDPPIGPDVQFVRDLRKAGEVCLGDWSVECEHWSDRLLHQGQMEIFHPARSPLQAYSRVPKPGGGWTLDVRPARGRRSLESTPAPPPAPAPAKKQAEVPQTRRVEEKSMRVKFTQAVCFRGHDVAPGHEMECPETLAKALEFRGMARIVESPRAAAVAPAPVAPPPAPPPAPVVVPSVAEVAEPDPVQAPAPEPEPVKPQRGRRGKKVS